MRSVLALAVLFATTVATAVAAAEEPPPAPPAPPAAPATASAPLTPEQQKAVEELIARSARPRYTLAFDVFMKGLYQNDQSNGTVWLGNPHPEGDNYAGTNGVAAVLGIRIDGRVNEAITAGARLETRFGQQFADFYENGDLATDAGGQPLGVDATGESLGLNHAAYAQLRGIYIEWDRPPVPTLVTARAGSSDLSLWNPWTVGKIRFIDRDNAKGFFFLGAAPSWGLDYNLARVALPKLYASAGFTSGIADPLVENPFWARDAAYAGKLHLARPSVDVTLAASYLLDEEADLDDPDALGSTNLLDDKDGVVTTIPRYTNLDATLETVWTPARRVRAELLVGLSHSDPDLGLVTNTIDGNEGLSPIPLRTVWGHAVRARAEAGLGSTGLTLRAEYFNIGADWVATFGARREADVLLTEGFLDGQLPTLNLANEFIDFTEPFYETIVGWHGATLKPHWAGGPVEVEVEGTVIGYNTNAQDRCTSRSAAPACEATGGIYPDFLFPDGMTDTDFFTYANTSDRGRDPRAAYRSDQERLTFLTAARLGLRFGAKDRGALELKARYIRDEDLRDTRVVGEDDYLGHLITVGGRVSWKLSDRALAALGVKGDHWDEAHRSGGVVAGEPRYPDYLTVKSKVFLDVRYEFPQGANLAYRLEYLNKDVDASDDALDFRYRHVVRSLATLYAGF